MSPRYLAKPEYSTVQLVYSYYPDVLDVRGAYRIMVTN